MSGFFRKIFTESKQQPKPDDKKTTPTKIQQQSMYELNVGGSEKVAPTTLFKSSEAEQPASQPTSQASKSQIKEKPSMFSKMKVKTKDEKKAEYEPVTIPEPSMARRYTQQAVSYSQPTKEPQQVRHVQAYEPVAVVSPSEPTANSYEAPPTTAYAPLQDQTPDGIEEKTKEVHTDASLQKSAFAPQPTIKTSQSSNETENITKKKSQVSTGSAKQVSKPSKQVKESLSSTSQKPKKQSVKKEAKEQPKPVTKKNEVEQIQESILVSKQQLFDIIKRQKNFKASIIDQSEQLQILKNEQTETIKQQNQAIEHEQFLLADALESKLVTIAGRITGFENQLAQLQSLYENSQREMIEYYVKENQHRKSHILRLKSVRDEASANLSNQEKLQHEWMESSKGRIERQRKKLSIIDNQIKFNEQKIEEIEHQYNEDLSNQTRKQKQQRDELDEKRKLLLIEIQQMERKLMAKKQQLVQLTNSVAEANDEIESIKKGFQVQYKKIIVRKEKLKDMVRERDQQNTTVNQLEKVTEERAKQGSAQIQVLTANIRYIDEQTESFEQDGFRFEQRLNLRAQKFAQFLEKSARLKEYQQQTRSKKEKIKQIEFKKSGLAVELGSLEARKKQLRDNIPVLESEKVNMINSKNWKGAASKAAQLKDANEKLLDVSSKMEKAFIEDKMLEQELTAALENNQSSKDEQQALRTQLAISQYRFELLKLEDLESERKTVSRCNVPSKTEKLLFIQNEITNLKEEVDFLKSEYGIDAQQKEQSPLRKVSVEMKKPSEQSKVEKQKHDQQMQRELDKPNESEPKELERSPQQSQEESKEQEKLEDKAQQHNQQHNEEHQEEHHEEEHHQDPASAYKPFVEEQETSYVPLSQ